MERTRIKICGLRRETDIRAANELRPDYIGFVFFGGSSRHVTEAEARTLREDLDPGIRAVGVFVDEDPERVAGLLNRGVIDLAQLHGHEDEAYLERLRQLTDKPLLQAFRIREAGDTERAERSSAAGILLDAGAGDGRAFDWRLLAGIRRPYFLAGGLNPDNVGEALRRWRPHGVDVSSGVETEGRKDPVKMRAFVDAVREAEKRETGEEER